MVGMGDKNEALKKCYIVLGPGCILPLLNLGQSNDLHT